jgi:leucyl-tRNA synthetase
MPAYDFTAIEAKWQQYWSENQTFRVPNPGESGFADKPKLYVLDMFPYPSGAGLHVGHPEGYTATDIVCRYGRMTGRNVLHPMGYDAFGLPAEQYAVEHGVHPRETTEANIANIERQIKMFGFSYDWSRRIATTDVSYYRWTQWIFLQLYNSWFDPRTNQAAPIDTLIHDLESGELVLDVNWDIQARPANEDIAAVLGDDASTIDITSLDPADMRAVIDSQRLAYMAEVPVNWCPALGTVLANEEVTNEGRSERGDHPVYRRAMRQWMLRITAYAQRLEDDLAMVDWPEPIKIMQRNWIGKSTGAAVFFRMAGVSPALFETLANRPKGRRPVLTATTFDAKDPYPNDTERPADLLAHVRNLPHVQLPGATYFITCNIADDRTLDEDDYQTIFDAFCHWNGQRCDIYALVLMGNHVHALIRPYEDHPLPDLLHSIKSYSAHQINERQNVSGSLWEGETFDHIVRDSWWFTNFVYYLCENPVRAGLCDTWDQWPWLRINSSLVRTVPDGEPFGNSGGGRDARDTELIEVYTTRPDTLFGATYMVLAPEHPLVEQITTAEQADAVAAYVQAAQNKSELERTAETKEKTGVFTGAYAINPVNDEKIPIWVADYVMMGYGTGAIMAVSAHDERDFEFAKQMELPIKQVVDRYFVTIPETQENVSPGEVRKLTLEKFTNSALDKNWGFIGVGEAEEADTIFLEGTKEAIEDFLTSKNWEHSSVRLRNVPLPYTKIGVAVNSGEFDGLPTAEFKQKITAWLEENDLGRAATNYKLRDWLFSRQRYWGEPFPIVHCETCGTVPLPEDQLPLTLPEMDDFSPASSDDPNAPPAPPLGKATDWVNTLCPHCNSPATRELNTMPQWAGSCWYYLRYLDPENDRAFCDPAIERYWMLGGKDAPDDGGVDLYVGGAEHAVLHLLYSRFWHKVLFDLGHVSTPEPFHKLFNQGMIRSFAYRDGRGVYIGYDDIDFRDDGPHHKATGEKLSESVEKMSKSLKNIVNPDEVIGEYGADTFRLYEMFMGPLEASKPWNTQDVPGLFRFLQRVWRMVAGDAENDQPALLSKAADDGVEKALHKLTKKVAEDIEAMKFNTAIAAMMEFVNTAFRAKAITTGQAERFVKILSPFAPHIAEELWQQLGHDATIAYEPWPEVDQSQLVEETVEIPVQVNGKVRGRISIAPDAGQDDVIAQALADAKVAEQVADKQIVKQIYVPGRMVNLVVKG